MATWAAAAVREIRPHVVKIQTMDGWGTGFFSARIPKLDGVGIATAKHVVERAHEWNQPIRLYCDGAEPALVQHGVKSGQWFPLFDESGEDAAVIVVFGDIISPPGDRLPRMDPSKYRYLGAEVGWVGYPSVHPDDLCFFSGCVSVYDEPRERYLLDGVVIPGVSGGPVFFWNEETNAVTVIGSITGYTHPRNRESVGLSVANEITKAEAIEKRLSRIFDPPPPTLFTGGGG